MKLLSTHPPQTHKSEITGDIFTHQDQINKQNWIKIATFLKILNGKSSKQDGKQQFLIANRATKLKPPLPEPAIL